MTTYYVGTIWEGGQYDGEAVPSFVTVDKSEAEAWEKAGAVECGTCKGTGKTPVFHVSEKQAARKNADLASGSFAMTTAPNDEPFKYKAGRFGGKKCGVCFGVGTHNERSITEVVNEVLV